MDNTAQCVLIAKRILRELRALNQAVSAGFLGIQKQVETEGKQQCTKNERDQTAPVLRANLQIPDAIISNWERENTKKARREYFAIGVSTVTLLAIIAYAIINYRMLCQMHDNLIAENRPWVTARVTLEEPPNSHSPKPGLTFNSDGSASFNCFIVVKNIGKSIATGIYIRAKMYPPPFQLFITDPITKQKAWCEKVRAEKPNTNMLPSLFPGEESTETETIPMTKKSIESALQALPANLAATNSVLPVVYGCVNWVPVFQGYPPNPIPLYDGRCASYQRNNPKFQLEDC
jgi:hypothetical protein